MTTRMVTGKARGSAVRYRSWDVPSTSRRTRKRRKTTPMIPRDFLGRGKVAVLKTHPETVLHDIQDLMHLAGYQQALPPEFETLLKINISWQTWYPACSSTPWQLEGAIRTLQADGYRNLIGAHNRTVVVDAYV